MSRVKTYCVRYPRVFLAVLVLMLAGGSVAYAQLMKLSDGTFANKVVPYTSAGVEGGSTTIVGTPDVNIAQVNGQTPLDGYKSGTLQNAATADGNGSSLTTNGYISARFNVAITNTAIVNFECSENGTAWEAMWAQREGATPTVATSTTVTSTQWKASIAGCQEIRARISGCASCTVTVTAHGVLGPTALVTQLVDPCQSETKSYGVIDLASSTATELIAGTTAKKTYICSISLVSATAQNVGVWSGTTTTTACDTGKGKMFGGSTAATGWNLAANGGIVLGNGNAAIAVAGANADKVCITSSSTGQLSGNYTYVVR